MMRSLSSAVGGLRSHQTRMDVIGNNIANVNTYGFKSSRATFSDVYYQTTSSGNANTGLLGGTNPTQIGYGASIATIDVLNAAAGQTMTDRSMDVYISGDSMIAVKDAAGNLKYTRLGALYIDDAGYLVDGGGNYVQGFGGDIGADGRANIDELAPINIFENEYTNHLGDDAWEAWSEVYISKDGAIIGTLAGDASASMTSGLPAWIQEIIVPEDSNIINSVNLKMADRYVATGTGTPASIPWLTDVQTIDNSGAEGSYDIWYDHSDGMIYAQNTNTRELLSGTYIRGGDVTLKDGSGKAKMTVTTDSYYQGRDYDKTTGTMTFEKQQWLTFTGNDVGGNALKYETRYTGQDSVTLGEGTTQLTVRINAGAVETALEYSVNASALTGNTAANALVKGISLSTNPPGYAKDGAIELWAGVSYDANVSTSSANYGYINFLDSAVLKTMLEDYSQARGSSGNINYSVEISLNPGSDEYTISIVDATNQQTIFESDPVQLGDFTTDFNYTGTTPAALAGYPVAMTLANGGFKADGVDRSAVGNLESLIKDSDFQAAWAQYVAAEYPAPATDPGFYTAVTYNPSPADNYTIEIYDSNNNALVFDGTIADGATSITLTDNTSHSLTITPVTISFNATKSQTYSNIGSTGATNLIQLRQNNVPIGDYNYTGSSGTITVGDFTLNVDSNALQAFFATGGAGANGVIQLGTTPIATLNSADVPQWAYTGKAASVSTGEAIEYQLGVMVLAKFANMAGMLQDGNSYFLETGNSGEPAFYRPGTGNVGNLITGYLESSNVDLSSEFTDMITTQRGFQANSRIITVSDEMLQELVNLKR